MARIFSENEKQMKYAAFFDLDKTLISEISGNALVRMAWKKGLITWTDLSRAFYLLLLFRLSLKDPLDIIEDMVGWVKGKSESEMEELCRNVASEVLLPSLYREAVTEINMHKSNGAKVIILSSALDAVCDVIAESLGIDGYICSRLQVMDGYMTGKPSGRLCYGNEKLRRLNGYCSENNINQELLWFYSDSISDLPVLLSVGNPVCVNPDRELRKEAINRGWKIRLWKSSIKLSIP
jgi:HAD superfamily hydrolase (TIGR01490 family)